MRPVVLDFDHSVSLPDAQVIALGERQEAIRFGCSLRELDRLDAALPDELGRGFAPVFFGSGDFHHVSYPLIRRAASRSACRVVVFDNHPDNMRFIAGIHCGSWVSHVAALPNVSRVDVVGITSRDVSAGRLWENRWLPLWRGHVHYWCVGIDTRWAQRFGMGAALHGFPTMQALEAAFFASMQNDEARVYLSIDKDVLHPEVARTNWDQGLMREETLLRAIELFKRHLCGMDVNGEVSAYRYRTPWKRWLSAVDGQVEPDPAQMQRWQEDQAALNRRLVAALSAA
jgi:arginase family enzyme